MHPITIDGSPLAYHHVTAVQTPDPAITQVTGTREACKDLIFYLGCELRQRSGQAGAIESYRVVDEQGNHCGQFHDVAPPQLAFKTDWLTQHA